MKLFTSIIITTVLLLALPLSAQVGIATTTVESSAMLHVESVTKGVLFPSMNSTIRDGISNPQKGLIVFNTDTNSLSINSGTPGTPGWDAINLETTNTAKIKQSSKFSNTDTSTNVNGTNVVLPIFGLEEWNDNSTLYAVSGNTMVVNEAGRYQIVVNVSLLNSTNGARKAPEARLLVDGTPIGTFASTGYIRNNSGHQESSLHINEVLELTSSSVVSIEVEAASRTGAVAMRSNGSSTFYIEKLN